MHFCSKIFSTVIPPAFLNLRMIPITQPQTGKKNSFNSSILGMYREINCQTILGNEIGIKIICKKFRIEETNIFSRNI